jgi:hypothetical protein
MRLALLMLLMPSLAIAEPAKPPKGKIANPWPHMPRPREGMKLPDPRTAAEKATSDGTVAPVAPEDTTPDEPAVEPSTEPDATAEPPPPVIAIPAASVVPLPAAPTPFRVTTYAYKPEPPRAPHEGLTLEAGTGAGWIHVGSQSRGVTSPGGVAGLSVGLGGWLNENVALTLRIAGSSVPAKDGVVVAAFIGPALQLWIVEHTWVGLGLGLETFGIDASAPENDHSLGGWGLDLRLGHTFYENGKHTLNASVEVTPGHVSEETQYGSADVSVASFGILFGWQYL